MGEAKSDVCSISVIIPVYQAECYLSRCMESVRHQTWKDYEMILVDDGSTDSSGRLCDGYMCSDQRVRVIHQRNQGLSAARNAGISNAKGQWIAFVDADDAVSPWYLERLYQAASRQNCEIAQCGFEPFYRQMPLTDLGDDRCEVFSGEEMQQRIYSPKRQIYLESTVSWNKLYRKELFEKISFPEGKIHEDEAVSYRLYAKAKRVAVLSVRLYWYYQNHEGIMGQKMNVRRLDYVEILHERYLFYKRRQQQILASKTAKQLYFTLSDAAVLRKQEVENYWQFRQRLQKLCRLCIRDCLEEIPDKNKRIRIRWSAISVMALSIRVPHFSGRIFRRF